MTKKNEWDTDQYQDKHEFVFKYGHNILSWLDPKPNEKVLDLGCGTGQLTKEISDSSCTIIGMDNSVKMIETAKKNYPNLDFQHKNAVNFSFPYLFDAVFSSATLHWVKPPESALNSIYKVLKPGGRFVAEFGGKGNVAQMVKALQLTFEKHHLVFPNPQNLWYFPSIAEYAVIVEKQGFVIHKMEHVDRPTRLKDNQTGIIDWFLMFADYFFADIENGLKMEILEETQENLKATHYIAGNWIADYKRIRIKATKPR